MKIIDDLIKTNKDFFDSEEPFEGHFERFSKKLEKREKFSLRFLNTFMAKASIIILIVGISSLLGYKYFIKKDNPKIPYSLSQISPELGEMQIYYTSTINEKYQQIENTQFPDKRQKEMLLNEINEMDSVYVSIVKDLKMYPKDERVINALINYYQVKISVMKQILEQLKQIENNKYSHENEEI